MKTDEIRIFVHFRGTLKHRNPLIEKPKIKKNYVWSFALLQIFILYQIAIMTFIRISNRLAVIATLIAKTAKKLTKNRQNFKLKS